MFSLSTWTMKETHEKNLAPKSWARFKNRTEKPNIEKNKKDLEIRGA